MTISSQSLADSIELFNIDDTTKFSVATLKEMLPDVETALFFCKVYELKYAQVGELIRKLFQLTIIDVLQEGDHSTELQNYIVTETPPDVLEQARPLFIDKPAPDLFLPELWASYETDIAKSIKEVALKLKSTVARMPGKQGRMVFSHMSKLNKQRPTIGTYQAAIRHDQVTDNLVILDDSGSMSEATVRALMDEVVGLSVHANAHLALVSYSTRHWEPGSYDTRSVLAQGQYGGTHYETLTPLLNRNWNKVITIADYDSSLSASEYIARHATGKIDQVLDISLVNQPSFLSECVGQLANEVHPLLIGNSYHTLRY